MDRTHRRLMPVDARGAGASRAGPPADEVPRVALPAGSRAPQDPDGRLAPGAAARTGGLV